MTTPTDPKSASLVPEASARSAALDAVVTRSPAGPGKTHAGQPILDLDALADTPAMRAGQASLVQPKEAERTTRPVVSSLVQPGANPPKRSTRIRGSERGA